MDRHARATGSHDYAVDARSTCGDEPGDKISSLPLLEISGLGVSFVTETGMSPAVRSVSLKVPASATVGIVGESGSGKSMTALAVMGLLPPGGEVVGGKIMWRGELLEDALQRKLRGSKVTLINQEPMSTLDPLMTVGGQVVEVLRKKRGMRRRDARRRAVELLDLVGIPQAERRMKQYPWEFSGGMAQRVVIALAIAPEPDLIIADEPTTALDVTTQAQILRLLAEIRDETGTSVVLITHDLGVVAGVADEVAVMYAGRVVEQGPKEQVFRSPRHPYTIGLLASTPDPQRSADRLQPIPGNPPETLSGTGCPFADRCERVSSHCVEMPALVSTVALDGSVEANHKVACWHAD